jgi:hypothetical protein
MLKNKPFAQFFLTWIDLCGLSVKTLPCERHQFGEFGWSLKAFPKTR